MAKLPAHKCEHIFRYLELPRSSRPRLNLGGNKAGGPSKRNVIVQYFASHHCAVCDALSRRPLCDRCLARPQDTALALGAKIRQDSGFYNYLGCGFIKASNYSIALKQNHILLFLHTTLAR